ncbi:hypothetical protein [Kribbella sp.]|uniref:hypothetical protein n=1 Tax=Kribbella sp. TaxID=1871183 RepID=UPI002D3D16BF|nr:hypothetical protein [Kribbella sp.]HZX05331.1 hypothetical protein [Kribbella sp.]
MNACVEIPAPDARRVRVWFGAHVIADYTAAPAAADRYQAAMARRFTGLRITVEPATLSVSDGAADL